MSTDRHRVVIKPATLEHVPAIQSIGLLTWPATFLPFTSPEYVLANLNTWWTREAVEHSVRIDRTVIAVDDNEVIGTLSLGECEGDSVIWKIYVVPAAQGRGIGSALMRHAIEVAGNDRALRLEYVQGNEHARGFYERHGFRHDCDEDPGDGTITVWMRRPSGPCLPRIAGTD